MGAGLGSGRRSREALIERGSPKLVPPLRDELDIELEVVVSARGRPIG